MKKPSLTLADYKAAAHVLGCDVAAVRAVTAVESSGQGFLADGRLVLRFEPHIFSRYTKGLFDEAYPHLSYPRWVTGYPKSINHSYELFREAVSLSPYYAGLSCSYGLFQVMGFNFTTCGCKTFKEFYQKMEESEASQLLLFCRYVQLAGLDDELRDHRWASFARAWNGALYQRNRYDQKLAQAHARYA